MHGPCIYRCSCCACVAIIFPGTGTGTRSRSQYQWSCSALETYNDYSYYALPNLNGFAANAEVVEEISLSYLGFPPSNQLDLYPVPEDLNCSGIVSAVNYCYYDVFSEFEELQPLFTLLLLEQNRRNFRVTHRFEISSTPTAAICTEPDSSFGSRFCCDVSNIDGFYLPAPNFAFGILTHSISLLDFKIADFPQFLAEHYSYLDIESRLTVNDNFKLEDGLELDDALRLFQFLISKFIRLYTC